MQHEFAFTALRAGNTPATDDRTSTHVTDLRSR